MLHKSDFDMDIYGHIYICVFGWRSMFSFESMAAYEPLCLVAVQCVCQPSDTFLTCVPICCQFPQCHPIQLTTRTSSRYPALEYDFNGGANGCKMPAQLKAIASLRPLSSLLLSSISNMGVANIACNSSIILFMFFVSTNIYCRTTRDNEILKK